MSLQDTLKEKSRQALLTKDTFTRNVMKNVLSEFLKEEKAATFKSWTSESEEAIVRRYIKSLSKAIELMPGTDIATSYAKEIQLLDDLLPKFLSEDETSQLIAHMVEGVKSLGQFVGAVMRSDTAKQYKIDASTVKKIGQSLGLR